LGALRAITYPWPEDVRASLLGVKERLLRLWNDRDYVDYLAASEQFAGQAAAWTVANFADLYCILLVISRNNELQATADWLRAHARSVYIRKQVVGLRLCFEGKRLLEGPQHTREEHYRHMRAIARDESLRELRDVWNE
jgi:hypothetical protein